ncbi:MAG: 30S ribosomal protein S1 [Candidatus Electryonea clarkiae]|nr:30S ribosomal protein S1 [Candidatus Electryonea clarkiae]MDP8289210.1 30S ribosomal protein S1 [Candidatus Electryonea clarkiae]
MEEKVTQNNEEKEVTPVDQAGDATDNESKTEITVDHSKSEKTEDQETTEITADVLKPEADEVVPDEDKTEDKNEKESDDTIKSESPKEEQESASTEEKDADIPALEDKSDVETSFTEPEVKATEDDTFGMFDEFVDYPASKLQVRNGEKFIRIEDLPKDSAYNIEQFKDLEKMYEDTLTEIKEGEIVRGKIVAISEKEVAVDIGFKSEGTVPIDEFEDISDLKVGKNIDVYLDNVEDSEGQLILSKKKADFMLIWDQVKKVYEADGIIRGRCMRRIKGGMVVDLGGVDAFLPGSQIDVRPIRDFESIIDQEMEFRILKINDLRKNIVISHKILVEESLQEVRAKLLDQLKVGDVLEGTVKNITDFGVFVDLGGVDGLLHITDLSWGRVSHPNEIVQLDQKIKVKVLNYDLDRKRISLGLKQLHSHLWDEIENKFRVGQKVQGKIVSLAKYGAFVEIESGIEGLVHISEMSWTQHIRHPSQVVREGEYVQVVILNIEKENRKISLGLKQVEDDPWEIFEAKYRIGTTHKGIVRDLVPFGAFVELEDSIDGLIHISDLSWIKKVRHPGEILKKAQEIEIIILDFDRDERRIALGYKQLDVNPWEMFEQEVKVGGKTSGTVTRVIDKGILVELQHKIEGFVPNSQIARKYFEGKKRNVQIGDIMKLVLLEFDKTERKVVLSNSQAQKHEETKQEAKYVGKATHGTGTTLADSLEQDNPLLQAYIAAKAEQKAEHKTKSTKKTAAKSEIVVIEKVESVASKKDDNDTTEEKVAEIKVDDKQAESKDKAAAKVEDKPEEKDEKAEVKTESEKKTAKKPAKQPSASAKKKTDKKEAIEEKSAKTEASEPESDEVKEDSTIKTEDAKVDEVKIEKTEKDDKE